MRFDPIWRRIKADDFTAKLEGPFRDSRDRLGELNNWGSLSWLYPHATASKLAHHYGIEHNAQHFLDGDQARERYRVSFRIASHAVLWGHVPLSYAGAEGIARAAHVSPEARKVVEAILKEVVNFGSLTCADQAHRDQCYAEVLNGNRPFELYKWLAAWLVSKRWKKIWKVVKSLAPEGVTEQEIRGEVIRTLVCREDAGYQLLDLCRLADYVPRDLQQAGTAWLSVDLEALWEVSPLRPDSAPEWSLLEASREYLEDRFFTSPDALLIHSLAGRVIAQGLISQGISKDTIFTLLTADDGDAHYFSTLADYHRRRLTLVRGWAKGESLGRMWKHVGTFPGVRIPEMSRLEAEDHFTGRSGTGRLSYPLSSNYSVVVDVGRTEPVGESQRVTVCLHHRDGDDPGPARPALDIALNAQRDQRSLRHRDLATDSLAGWIAGERVEVRPLEQRRAAGAALVIDKESLREILGRLKEISAFDGRRDRMGRSRELSRVLGMGMPANMLGRFVFDLPFSAQRAKAGTELLGLLRGSALSLAAGSSGSVRGAALEVAVAADQLLSTDECTMRVLVLGATALSEEGKALAEWDVWRLDLLKNRDWRLVAVECTVAPTVQKQEGERERLERLRQSLQGRFSDLAEYRTRLVTISGGKLKYTDAARGFVRT